MASRTIDFTKMNGAGNDFVMLDARAEGLHLTKEQIARLCDRHRGIGSDGLIAVELPEQGADFKMRYFNADGGEAEMCGNGARCFSRFAATFLPSKSNFVSFETQAGIIRAEIFEDGSVEIGMSTPHSMEGPFALPLSTGEVTASFINTGVPHAVVLLDSVSDLEGLSVRETGREIRFHERFAPAGTNANFAAAAAPGALHVRTYERGVEDETLACGTGVTACALIYHLATGVPSPVTALVRGGDVLSVRFEKNASGGFENVRLRGPADFVFTGTVGI